MGNYLLVDDTIMFGTHMREAARLLQTAGVPSVQILPCSFLVADSELLDKRPRVEHEINERFSPSASALKGILGQARLPLTLRLVRCVLKAPPQVAIELSRWMEEDRPEVRQLIARAIAD